MRLKEVKQGRGISLKHRLIKTIMNLFAPGGAPGVVLTLMYKHHFLGKSLNQLFQEAMRGKSELSFTQRELIAAAVSQANQCPFCHAAHAATASLANAKEKKMLMDFSTRVDDLRPGVDKATLAIMNFAAKLTRDPDHIEKKDLELLRKIGFSKLAIEDAIYIVFAFCTINRLANSLGFDIPSEAGFKFSGKFLVYKGYEF